MAKHVGVKLPEDLVKILKNGKIIFTNGNPIEYEEDGFRINDKKYEYTGIRLKKIK